MGAAEDHAVAEQLGRDWQQHSDEFLVGYVAQPGRQASFHTTAVVEAQRRLLVALRDFNTAAGKQADTMIHLTQWIIALTIILGLIALFQLLVMAGV